MLEWLLEIPYEECDDEDEDARDGEGEADALPEDVVAFVGHVEILVERVEEEEGESEGHEVLDGEHPPVLKKRLPPIDFVVAFILAHLGHPAGQLAHAKEADAGQPLLEAEARDEPGNNPENEQPSPEGYQADPAFC